MKKKYKDKIIRIINKHIPMCKIYLFGSRSRGSHTEGSDIDLAIKAPQQIDDNLMSEIKKHGVLWHS